MGVPEILLIGLILLSLGNAAARHGQQRPRWNFPADLLANLILFGLLFWGGFFS